LNDKKDIRREKKEKKRQKRKREEGRRFGEGTGGDASGHEVSLVTTATNKKRVLEMIRGWLSALSGGRNKVFADRLMAIVWKGLY